jgi:hypothetical protein
MRPKLEESSHGIWERRLIVVAGYSPADHHFARHLYAPLSSS